MNYDRVVSGVLESGAISTADDPIIELQMPANTQAEIIRLEIGAAEGADPLAEIQELVMYKGPNAGTGGAAVTETILNGGGTIQGVVLSSLTAAGASTKEWYFTGFHWQNGWLYLPVPAELVLLKAGDDDNFGFYFPTAPDASTTFSTTLIWGEIG
jgi:hypothetical protein